MRLIDADELKEHFPKDEDWEYPVHTNSGVVEIIDDAPRVDPVKHGHWIEHDVGLICSECGHYTESMYDEPFNNKFGKGWALKRPYYCGYCGAKMNEVEE